MNAKRILAGLIDFFIIGVIQSVLMMLFLIKPLMVEGVGFNILIRQFAITYCSMGFFIIRDIIGKRSIGKKIMKLKIINKNDGQETSSVRKILRNLTWLLGPIDIIFYLITKERMGDQLVKTNVIEV